MLKPTITIENIEAMRVIYVRFRGSYNEFRKNSRKLFEQLFSFAEANQLIIPDVSKVLTIYHDNPFITDAKNLRTSVAMTIPLNAAVTETDEISSMVISGNFGVGHFELNLGEYGDAWNYMYQDWLFSGENKARDAFPFELYVSEPPKNFKAKSLTDIYIPIE
ncbi:AraC family transcriptional regulator [Culicoidibacter larvae]|uniref:AraC family transcriptional regulator n=1 Tax=Culicoidibacter larvae TaxID=2579976 RepID=A0A5R8Q7T5_9FIRM|nr:GyrI-like domain-containing protein [Culicoidibacter larvae]TLG71546.1 AraC family transcriptional regulator [Culicoidibacter larvae]